MRDVIVFSNGLEGEYRHSHRSASCTHPFSRSKKIMCQFALLQRWMSRYSVCKLLQSVVSLVTSRALLVAPLLDKFGSKAISLDVLQSVLVWDWRNNASREVLDQVFTQEVEVLKPSSDDYRLCREAR